MLDLGYSLQSPSGAQTQDHPMIEGAGLALANTVSSKCSKLLE